MSFSVHVDGSEIGVRSAGIVSTQLPIEKNNWLDNRSCQPT